MSNTAEKLRILLIDNEPERLYGLRQIVSDDVELTIRDPFDVEISDLEGIDLVSVDEFLGEEWEAAVDHGQYSSPAAIRNRDGLAVAAAFRSQSRRTSEGEASAFAVTLHTGDLERLASGLPKARREAMTAAQHDLEWVFAWGEPDFLQRVVSLARAVDSAARNRVDSRDDFGASWLRVPNEEWAETALAQIEDCRPPAYALAKNTDGRSLVRWLAHRILPYPAFLLNEAHGANLLGVTEESFLDLVQTDFAMSYLPLYQGPLGGFLGRRWWRAALQQILVDLGLNEWDAPEARATGLSGAAGVVLTPLGAEHPVVAYNEHGDVSTIDAEAGDAVRLQADGWPVYADDAWALRKAASGEPALRALVAHMERSKLEPAP